MSNARQERYANIGDYGLLGDGHGCALAAADGRIDWLAVPRIDTPPFFAALLDEEEGGYLLLAPACDFEVERRYLPATMVLETCYRTGGGTLRVTDALTQGFQGRLPWSELARRVEAVDGPVPVRWEVRPGTRLATVRPWAHEREGIPFVLSGGLLAAVVVEGLGAPITEHDHVRGEAVVEPGRPALLALVLAQDQPLRVPRPEEVLRRLGHTVRQWEEWSGLIGYEGPYEDQLRRSALTIKALASLDSGALAAAPTTSIPEVIGGSKNFDYRYGWVRDSSFMIDALSRLGLSEEVDASLTWLLKGVRETAPDVHVFYTLDGRPASGEQTKMDLYEGYERSDPVTIGNKAAVQTQHGSYGDLFGAVARYVDHGGHLDTETGLILAKLADRLCDEWPKPDAGLWELGEYRRYTSSLINSWNALDCASHLTRLGEMPELHLTRWEETRERIHRFADEQCWSDAKRSYTFYAGTEELDAAVLLAARCGFLGSDDPRLWTTIDAVRRELTAEGPLLYRYSSVIGKENAFVACTFWLIEALAITGRTDEAGELLEGALSGANDLDLWSEEVEPSGGRLTGNFPIGISHLAVVGALSAYADAVGRKG